MIFDLILKPPGNSGGFFVFNHLLFSFIINRFVENQNIYQDGQNKRH